MLETLLTLYVIYVLTMYMVFFTGSVIILGIIFFNIVLHLFLLPLYIVALLTLYVIYVLTMNMVFVIGSVIILGIIFFNIVLHLFLLPLYIVAILIIILIHDYRKDKQL